MTTTNPKPSLLIVVIGGLTISAACCQDKPAAPVHKFTPICAITSEEADKTLILGGGSHFAFVRSSQGGRETVVLDGKPGAEFSKIDLIRFSPDGRRLAYVAQVSPGRSVVVSDGQSSPEFPEIRNLAFSLDGRRMAFVAMVSKDRFTMVVDGQSGPEYFDISEPSFSTDGSRIAYMACLIAGSEKSSRLKFECVVVDGKPGETYAFVGPPVFSLDGKRMAYVAGSFSPGGKCGQCLILDGQPGPYGFCQMLTSTSPSNFRREPFALRGAFWSPLAGWGLMGIEFRDKDGKLAPAYDPSHFPVFSPDGKRIAYIEAAERAVTVVVDGQKGESYAGVSLPVFSADSQRIMYSSIALGLGLAKRRMVIDGVPGPFVSSIEGALFSPDSKRVAYVATSSEKSKLGGSMVVVVDGRESPGFDSIHARSLLFSPDSKRVGFIGMRERKQMVVVDGRPGLKHDGADSMHFSSDGKRGVYVATEQGKSFVVLNGRPGPPFDQIVGTPDWTTSAPDSALEYLAIKSGMIGRVLFTPSPGG